MPLPIECDTKRHEVRIQGRRVDAGLSVQEFTLLEALCSKSGEVSGRDELGGAIWGAGNFEYNMLHRLVHRTKRKLTPFAPDSIVAISGVGYKIEITEPPALDARLDAAPASFDDTRFVGRIDELKQLTSVLDAARGGAGALVMLAGEPGIGKTRIAEEICTQARASGVRTLTGRCYEGEASMPYAPFVEALRQYARPLADDALRAALGREAAEIAMLLPELRTRFDDIADPSPISSDMERLHLFECVTQLLRRMGAEAPLVLVLDDLHWADKPTLLLLQYAVHNAGDAPIMFIGAYRDVEVDRVHPLAEALAALRREPRFHRIRLGGLPEEQIAGFLPSGDGIAPEGLAAAVSAGTEGNPFFVREVVRNLIEEGKLLRDGDRWTCVLTNSTDLGLPEGVREVVSRRLSRLSDDCNRMLTSASAATDGMSWDVLRTITGFEEEPLLDMLDEALDAQILREDGEGRAAKYDFTHALIRQTIYDELSTPRQILLHRKIGEALESVYAGDLEAHLPELAYHFYAAAPGGDVAKAVDYLRRAGQQAHEGAADEDAIRQLNRALLILVVGEPSEKAVRGGLLVALANAEALYEPAHCMAHAIEAAAVAREIGDAEMLAAAALAHTQGRARTSYFRETWSDDRHSTARKDFELLRAALSALGQTENATRVRVQARVAEYLERASREVLDLPDDMTQKEASELAAEAIQIASRLEDPQALKSALVAQWLILLSGSPDETARRLQLSSHIVELSVEADPEAHLFRFADLLELGELHEAKEELARAGVAAQKLGKRYRTRRELLAAQSAIALFNADLRSAEECAVGALTEAAAETAVGGTNLQAPLALYLVRREQGRAEELLPVIKNIADELGDQLPAYDCGVALLCAELGRAREARDACNRALANPRVLAHGPYFGFTTAALSEACAFTGDASVANAVYKRLLPFGAYNTTYEIAVCMGSIHRLLGMLASTLAQWGDAERHFQDALAANERMDTPLWLGYTQYNYATMLLARQGGADTAQARGLLTSALGTARRCGLAALESKIDAAMKSMQLRADRQNR